jgi:O-antigen polymerase
MLRKIAYALSILLILLTPFIYSNELYNGVISAKQFWFYGAMALLMLITAIDMLFDRYPLTLQFSNIDLALLVFFAYYTIRAATTPYMPVLHNQRWINWTLCIILYFIIKRVIFIEKIKELKEGNQNTPFFHSFIINFLILTGFVQALWGLLQLYGFLPSFNSNFKVTGTFFNPAPYAMLLAVIFPIAVGQIIKNKKLRIKNIPKTNGSIFSYAEYPIQFLIVNTSFFIYYLSFATVITILLVLPATMIRAAWLTAFVGAIVVSRYWLKRNTRLGSWLLMLGFQLKYKIVAVALALVVLGLIGTGLFYLKKDSANSKLFIWKVTLGKIAEKPLCGYGVGRFEAEYNNWQAEYFQKHPEEMDGPKGWVAGNTKYAFNEFLEIASESGIIGLLLFLLIIVSAFYGVKKLNNMYEARSGFFLPSFFILSLLSFPFYNEPLLLLFFTSLVLIPKKLFCMILPKAISITVVTITIAVLFTLSVWLSQTLSKKYTAYKTWQQANYLYGSSLYQPSANEFEKIYPILQYNGDYLQQYGKCIAMNKNFEEAQEIFIKAQYLIGDPILYLNLGDCYYINKKDYKLAEHYYIMADYMMPHKLYPKYILAKYYEITKQEIKAKLMANRLLKIKVKVQSKAIDEMKTEMRELIKKYDTQ